MRWDPTMRSTASMVSGDKNQQILFPEADLGPRAFNGRRAEAMKVAQSTAPSFYQP